MSSRRRKMVKLDQGATPVRLGCVLWGSAGSALVCCRPLPVFDLRLATLQSPSSFSTFHLPFQQRLMASWSIPLRRSALTARQSSRCLVTSCSRLQLEQRRSYSIPVSSSPFPAASIPPPLKGIRVLDLTRILAGPYCTMLLSDLGADVIKVEDPQGGDGTRSWLPPAAPTLDPQHFPKGLAQEEAQRWLELPPESAYFLSVNRGKRSLTLDLRQRGAQDIIQRLIRESDVVVENYLPGKLAKFGLGYEQVKAIKPDIIYASLTGYGQSGPYSTSPGYDVIIAADAGLMHMWVPLRTPLDRLKVS